MAGAAINGSVRTCQGEAVVVLLDIFDSHLPSPDGVALFAVSAQLAPVNISVAVLTTLADV